MSSDVHKAGEELSDTRCGRGVGMPNISPLLKYPGLQVLLDMALGDGHMDGLTSMNSLFGKSICKIIPPDARVGGDPVGRGVFHPTQDSGLQLSCTLSGRGNGFEGR